MPSTDAATAKMELGILNFAWALLGLKKSIFAMNLSGKGNKCQRLNGKVFMSQPLLKEFIFEISQNNHLQPGLLKEIMAKGEELIQNEGVTFADFCHIYA